MTYKKFGELADSVREAGVERMPIRACFDNERERAGVLSQVSSNYRSCQRDEKGSVWERYWRLDLPSRKRHTQNLKLKRLKLRG